MNEIVEKEEIKVKNMIYEIRGKQVMLDSDLDFMNVKMEQKRLINLLTEIPKNFLTDFRGH